jgi:multicomponent Na+:H+ antiporter subunit D
VSILTLFSMIKIWAEAFWKPLPAETSLLKSYLPAEAPSGAMHILVSPIIVLAAITVIVGLAAEPVFSLAFEAAEQLMNPAGYIQAVMGGNP